MRKLFFLLIILFIVGNGFSQGFQKSYPDLYYSITGNDLAELSDNSIVIAGTLSSNHKYPAIRKVNSQGEVLWTRTLLPDSAIALAVAIEVNALDEIFVLSQTDRIPYEFHLSKLNSSGVLIWDKILNLPGYSEVTEMILKNNRFYISGCVNSNFGFVSVDLSGNIVVNTSYDFGASDRATGICITHDNFVVLCGEKNVFGAIDTVIVMKADTSGALIWELREDVNVANGQAEKDANSADVEELNSGELVFTGGGYNSQTWPSTFVMKINPTGSLHTFKWLNALSDIGIDVVAGTNDSYYVLGAVGNFGFYTQLWKLDKFDNVVFSKKFGYPANNKSYATFNGAFCLLSLKNNFLAFTGVECEISNKKQQLYLVKADSTGTFSSTPDLTISMTGSQFACEGDSILLVAQPGFQKYIWLNSGIIVTGSNYSNDSIYTKESGNYYCYGINGSDYRISAVQQIIIKPKAKDTELTGTSNKICGAAGESVSLLVPLSDSVQWYRNNIAIPGATSQSYLATASGSYSVEIIGNNPYYGTCDIGRTRAFYVDAEYVPVPVINCDANCVGRPYCAVGDSLKVDLLPNIKYEWIRNGVPLPDTLNYLLNYPIGSYQCSYKNACGTKISDPFVVYTGPAGNSIQYFSPVNGCGVGSSVMLYAPLGSSGPYQWYLNNVSINGATSPTYVANQSGKYKVRYFNHSCNSLLVTYEEQVTLNTPQPVITASPSAVSCTQPVKLTASPGGLAVAYQWYKNDVLLNGAVSQQLSVYKSGRYKCKVTNPVCGAEYSNAIEVIVGANKPTITSSNDSVCSGGNVVEMVCYPLSPALQYQWFRNGQPIAGSTGNSLSTTDSGYYYCKITSPCGSTKSDSLKLVGVSAPAANVVLDTVFTHCYSDSNYIFAPIYPNAEYKWMVNGFYNSNIKGTFINIGQTATYSVQINILGCTVQSPSVYCKIESKPQFTFYYSGLPEICSGDSATVRIAGTTGPNNYHWFRNNTLIALAIDSFYTIKSDGEYYFTATNGLCMVRSEPSIEAIVKSKPTAVLTANGPLSFCAGDSLQLQVNSNNPYSYQWKRNGSVIPAAISSTYFAKLQGNYRAGVYSPNGCLKESSTLPVTVPCRFEESLQSAATLYPNPSNEFTDLFLPQEVLSDELRVEVTDLRGRIVNLFYSKEVDHIRFFASDQGDYLIKVVSRESIWVKHWLVIR